LGAALDEIRLILGSAMACASARAFALRCFQNCGSSMSSVMTPPIHDRQERGPITIVVRIGFSLCRQRPRRSLLTMSETYPKTWRESQIAGRLHGSR
jgi:hypothetical protein